MQKLAHTLTIAAWSLTACLGASHWDHDQSAQYVHYSDLQRRSSWQLLSQIDFRGDERVLDIGCGDGRNSAMISRLVRRGCVLGLDPSAGMIDWALKQYHPYEYPNLAFGLGDFDSLPCNGQFDLVTSLFSLHTSPDKFSALSNIYHTLRPGGTLVAVIPPPLSTNPQYQAAFGQTVTAPKWAHFFSHLRPSFMFEPVEVYAQLLDLAGFEEYSVEFVPSVDPFVNEQEYIEWLLGTWPHVHCLPRARCAEFARDILTLYRAYRPEAFTDDGVVRGYWGRIELIATK